jgi:signal transduction histidine kinase
MLEDNGSSLGELHLLAYRGFNAEAAKFWKRVDIESQCVCGEALRTRQRVIIRDVTKADFMAGTNHLATYLETGIAAVQTTPLVSRSGTIVGMISTHWNHPHEPSERDLRLFDILARQAADLLERKHAVDALRATQAQLLQHTADLEKIVSERTARLSETVHELESFSYSITHDLRTPLRAMQSFADILCEEHAGKLDEAAKGYLRRINTSARRMDKLIEDVLVYSRVLRMDLQLEPVDVNKLLRGMLESYPHLQEPAADVKIENELPPVLGNEAALTQCFSNLLGNAIKFVAPGAKPRVRISAEQSGGKVRFWIADNGIGIDPRHSKRVFGTFQRLSTSYEGTGIGLTIVRKAVERLGGAVGVESELGKGSRFWLDLSDVPEQNPASYESSNGALCGR